LFNLFFYFSLKWRTRWATSSW